MSETATQAEAPVNAFSQRVADDIFGGNQPAQHEEQQPQQQTKQTETSETKTETQAEQSQTEIQVPVDWLKKEFNTDDFNYIKTQLTELNELKSKQTEQFSWKNSDSQKMAEYINEGKQEELYNFLHTQTQAKKLSTADVNDKKVAEQLVKFGIRNDNPDSNLSDDDVDFLFNEKYSIPSKPIQQTHELDEDYNNRVATWQNQANATERRMLIEAKMNQPKLSQLLKELQLPEIKRENPKPSDEELAKVQKMQQEFLQKATASVNSFSGFTAQIKNKDVDYSVSYSPSQEEKKLVSDAVQVFANNNFDANAIFVERWLNKDGSINEIQMTEDLSRILMGKNSDAKIASEAANQRLEMFIKEKKNINILQGGNQSFVSTNGTTTKSEQLQEKFWGS